MPKTRAISFRSRHTERLAFLVSGLQKKHPLRKLFNLLPRTLGANAVMALGSADSPQANSACFD